MCNWIYEITYQDKNGYTDSYNITVKSIVTIVNQKNNIIIHRKISSNFVFDFLFNQKMLFF